MNLTCEQAREERPFAEVGSALRAAIDRHAGSCDACRAAFALDDAIDALAAREPEIAAEPEFAARVAEAVGQEQRAARSPRRWMKLGIPLALAAAALLAVALRGGLAPEGDRELIANLDAVEHFAALRGNREAAAALDLAALESNPSFRAISKLAAADGF